MYNKCPIKNDKIPIVNKDSHNKIASPVKPNNNPFIKKTNE